VYLTARLAFERQAAWTVPWIARKPAWGDR